MNYNVTTGRDLAVRLLTVRDTTFAPPPLRHVLVSTGRVVVKGQTHAFKMCEEFVSLWSGKMYMYVFASQYMYWTVKGCVPSRHSYCGR